MSVDTPLPDDEAELRRLRWRCRRGMRELDRLLETEDDRLWHWFMGHDTPTDAELSRLVRHIRAMPA